MADIFGKIEGLAGLALLGGVAYAALKFGPGIIKAFKGAIDGLNAAHQVVSPRAGVEAHGDAVRAALDAEQRALAAGDVAEAERQNAIAWQEAYKSAVDAGSTTLGWNPILQASTRFFGDLAVDKVLGRGATSTGTSSAVSFVSGQPADIKAAQDARTEKSTKPASYLLRGQGISEDGRRYNAWLRSTKPASESVSNFLNAGKQYQGQREVSPGVYVSPSGAYQIIRDGQIVSSGSAGAVQGLQEMARRATGEGMYPGTNYRREVVEGYQAKARAGDAAARAWLKRFAPAGAV